MLLEIDRLPLLELPAGHAFVALTPAGEAVAGEIGVILPLELAIGDWKVVRVFGYEVPTPGGEDDFKVLREFPVFIEVGIDEFELLSEAKIIGGRVFPRDGDDTI